MNFIQRCGVLGWLGLTGLLLAATAAAQPVKQGAATYFLSPKGGDRVVPAAPLRSDALLKTAAPTNQWYSSLIFNPKPEVIYAQPLTFQATPAGFELALPSKLVLPTERRDVEIHYPHTDPLVISPADFALGTPKLAKASDWAIDIAMGQGADQMLVTVAHGSPYASVQISRGDVRLKLPAAAERIAVPSDARVLALQVKGRRYALFGPTGVRWEQVSPTEWLGRLPAGSGYLSATALPDDTPETLALLTRHAYAFLQDTRVEWRFDAAASQVESTFKASTRVMEGPDNGPLLGLYPHQWFKNEALQAKLGPAFDTVRGKIRLLAAAEFKTTQAYTGFVPFWPGVTESPRKAELAELMKTDQRNARRMMLEIGTGAYWQGKGLQRITQLMNVVEQQGDLDGRNKLLKLSQKRIEDWFSGDSSKTYFHYDKALGTVVAYPEEYFSVEQMNDHHFHYGYWIRAMADIALRDPAWASSAQWGGMVDLLIADIATPQRGRADFPFLRNFDPYEGHSWASGIGLGPFGNNQESSSEAINAWAGLILWGEITGRKDLRDLGLYLYTTEIDAINHYWFDIHGQVLAPEYKNVEVSMLFGGKYAHNTWWTDEPRQIKGINLLPITTASTYLGRDAAYVKRNVDALKPEMASHAARGGKRADPPDIWQDIFAQYLALSDPALALAQWERWGSFELGDTRSHALHWMLSLQEMGTPDFSVRADTTLYSVFRRADGRKTYLAYNATPAAISVRFSDGKTLAVAPGQLARSD
jgi:endoglucanase Acf2